MAYAADQKFGGGQIGRSETKKSGVERCGWTCGNELAVWRS